MYEIRTRITEDGSELSADGATPTVVGRRDRQTRAVRWEALDQDLTYPAVSLDHSVVAKDQIRTVVRELAARPGRLVA